jgi:ankyrin repeat protein
VNVVEKFHNQTPLMYAAAATRNAGEMVKLLLAKSADVKPRALFSDWPSQITSEPRAQYRPVGGLTALLYAARSGCKAQTSQAAGAPPATARAGAGVSPAAGVRGGSGGGGVSPAAVAEIRELLLQNAGSKK